MDERVGKRKDVTDSDNQATSPLLLEGWSRFNQAVWGVRPFPIDRHPEGSMLPSLRSILYLDRHGKITFPPRNPYLAFDYRPTPSQQSFHLSRQWLTMVQPFVEEMRRRGLRNTVLLPPSIRDVRPWQWAGFRAAVRYTLMIDFPYDASDAESEVRRQIKRAASSGYRCDRTTKAEDVLVCLRETEARQDFRHELDRKQLELACRLIGEEYFRMYACYAPNGEPACAKIVLANPGAQALNWVMGTKSEHLARGVTQYLTMYSFEDLETFGVTGVDLTGANLPTVSAWKEAWGGRLVPYCTLEDYSLRQLAKWGRDWFRFLKGGKERH